jgi:hypothetical protein
VNWNFYLAFSVFRLAAVSQGLWRRVLAGIAASNRRAEIRLQARSRQALTILQR